MDGYVSGVAGFYGLNSGSLLFIKSQTLSFSVKNICSIRGDCLKQKPESLNMRASIAEQEAAVARAHQFVAKC